MSLADFAEPNLGFSGGDDLPFPPSPSGSAETFPVPAFDNIVEDLKLNIPLGCEQASVCPICFVPPLSIALRFWITILMRPISICTRWNGTTKMVITISNRFFRQIDGSADSVGVPTGTEYLPPWADSGRLESRRFSGPCFGKHWKQSASHQQW